MAGRFSHLSIWHILLVYVILALAFSVATPIFETPDELHHIYFVKYLAENHKLPVLGKGERDGSAMYGQEGGQPPLYYAVASLLVNGIDMNDLTPEVNPHANVGNPLLPGNKNHFLHGQDESWPWHGMTLAVHLMRLFSILLGVGTVFLAWKIAQDMFPNTRGLPLAVASFVAFLPQFLFISAAVTNDNLITFLATLILWLILHWFGADLQKLPENAEAVVLGIFLGLAALSKLNGLDLWALVALVYLLHIILYRDLSDAIPKALLTGLAAIAIAVPWYWRNWQLYGDPTGLAPFLEIVGARPEPIHLRTELQGLRISLLALFGWFSIPLPDFIYKIWDAFLAISAIGFLQGVWRRRFHLAHERCHIFLVLLALWLGLMSVSLAMWTKTTFGTQGRLLFPAISSLAILIMLGWREWLPGRKWWLSIPPAVLLALSIYSASHVIPAAYRPPKIITVDDIPADARIQPVVFDERIALVGAKVQPETLHPGDKIFVTLYWQAINPIPYNASVTIHVYGQNFSDVAQLDAYPGWGAFPTSFWQPGKVIQDQYFMQLSGGTPTPTKLVVSVGLYDFVTKQHYLASSATGEVMMHDIAILRALPAQQPQYAITHPTDFRFNNSILLAGYDLPEDHFAPGQTLPLTLYWQGLTTIEEDYQIFVHLIDESGQLVAGYDKSPRDGWWPTSMWEPGQTFDDDYPMPLPPELPPGDYELRTGLYRLSDLHRLPVTGPQNQIIDDAAVLTKITISP